MTLLAALLFVAAQAQTADEIIDKAQTVNEVESSIQTVRMTIVSKRGSERVRELEMRARKEGEVRKSVARFKSPSDVAGVSLLLIDTPDAVDDQQLYMPATKATTRISGSGRKGSFMGTDFSYEDFEQADASAVHTLIEQSDDVWVIDTDPGKASQYGRVRAHVSKSDYIARKVEFFDKDDEPLKLMEVLETAKEGDKTLPVKTSMQNLKRGTSTRMEVLERTLDLSLEDLPDDTFTKAWLER